MKIRNLGQMIAQFANTFKEWHYFTGGFNLGFVLGLIMGWFMAILTFMVIL